MCIFSNRVGEKTSAPYGLTRNERASQLWFIVKRKGRRAQGERLRKRCKLITNTQEAKGTGTVCKQLVALTLPCAKCNRSLGILLRNPLKWLKFLHIYSHYCRHWESRGTANWLLCNDPSRNGVGRKSGNSWSCVNVCLHQHRKETSVSQFLRNCKWIPQESPFSFPGSGILVSGHWNLNVYCSFWLLNKWNVSFFI